MVALTWAWLKAALPFLSGVIGGAAVIVGFLLAWNSRLAVAERDWQYFAVQFLSAACIGVGGVLVLIGALELRK